MSVSDTRCRGIAGDVKTPVGTFLTESEFITYLFSHGGDCQIRLVAADCAYIGYVSL